MPLENFSNPHLETPHMRGAFPALEKIPVSENPGYSVATTVGDLL
jgi:hypothetical protein